jgi:hypothetical protein
MVDANGTTKYTYTAGNQVWTEIQGPTAATVTNTYANRLRTILTLQQAPGRPLWTNAFAYDAAGRMTNVTSPAGSFSYILGGASFASRLTKKLLLPNTSYITNTFDPVARLTGTYLYDGNLVIQERNGLPTVTYTRGPDLSGTMQGAGGLAACSPVPAAIPWAIGARTISTTPMATAPSPTWSTAAKPWPPPTAMILSAKHSPPEVHWPGPTFIGVS